MAISDSKTSKALRAFNLWAAIFKRQSDLPNLYEFAAFLGDPHTLGRQAIVNIDNPAVMEKVEKILGPHGRTILKVMKANAEQTVPTDGISKDV